MGKESRSRPRIASEIFLRGVLRTLWDIDKLLRANNDVDELTKYAKSPMVLSVLRVMAYEFMWMPSGNVRTAVHSVTELMDRCRLEITSERDWICSAVVRLSKSFEKSHQDWEKKKRVREEKKRAA